MLRDSTPSRDQGSRVLRVAPAIATQRTMGVVIGALFAVAGLIGLVTTLLEQPPHRDPGVVLAVLAAIAGIVLMRWAERLPWWVLRVVPVGGALVVTAAVLLAAGTELAAPFAALYLFVMLDSFVFFGWPFAVAHLLLCAALHLGTVALTGQPMVEVVVQEIAFGATGLFVGILVRAASAASIDALTGLLDRGGFDRRIEQAVRGVQADGGDLAVVLIDLDGFTAINQQQGPERGDEVLVRTARVLSEVVAPGGVVCRFGSDEFVVILPGAGRDEAMGAVEQMRRALVPVTFSAAVAGAAPMDTRASLTRRLINALHRAGEQGGHRTVLADGSDRTAARLYEAIENGRLEVHYQPVVALPDGAVVGAEALVRWVLEDGTLVTPDRFIPDAEADGSIVALGRWVMGEACRQCAAWAGTAGMPQRIAVNVSHAELCRAGYVDEVLRICARAGVAPGALIVEVTETTLGREDGHVLANLTALRAAGVGVSIDDFGIGYSSLSRLQEMPVTQLKIDRAFVMRLDGERSTTPVLVAIVALARAMGLEIVAEGVETEDQANGLVELGVWHAQGYLFARPTRAADLVQTVVARAPQQATRCLSRADEVVDGRGPHSPATAAHR